MLSDVQSGRVAECQAIANLGGAGRTNSRRDYNKLIAHLDYGLEPILHRVEVKDLHNLDTYMLDLPMLAPHEIVGAIYRAGWSLFSEVFFGGIAEGGSQS